MCVVVPPRHLLSPPTFPFHVPLRLESQHNLWLQEECREVDFPLCVSCTPVFWGIVMAVAFKEPPPPASAKACCFPETGVVLPKVVRLSLLGGHESCL